MSESNCREIHIRRPRLHPVCLPTKRTVGVPLGMTEKTLGAWKTPENSRVEEGLRTAVVIYECHGFGSSNQRTTTWPRLESRSSTRER